MDANDDLLTKALRAHAATDIGDPPVGALGVYQVPAIPPSFRAAAEAHKALTDSLARIRAVVAPCRHIAEGTDTGYARLTIRDAYEALTADDRRLLGMEE